MEGKETSRGFSPSVYRCEAGSTLDRTMQIYIFRGPGRVFGCTPDATGANLPSQFAPWNAFKSIELRRGGESTPGVNADECLDDVEKYGFHITDAHVRITENAVPVK
jgi:hypothetical protein